MATPFPTSPQIDQSSSKTTTNDIIKVSLGNGYEQRTPNGINYIRDKWSVTWSGLNTSERDTIVAFIQAISDGSVATWTTPFDSSSKKFILEGDWSISDGGGAVYNIAASFKQVFDV